MAAATATPPTSLTWATSPGRTPGAPPASLVAVGAADGSVSAFDAAGRRAWAAPLACPGGVVAVCAGADTILAVGVGRAATPLAAADGGRGSAISLGRAPPRAAALTPDTSSLVVGTTSLTLYRTTGGGRIARHGGHGGPVVAVATAAARSGAWVVSAGSGDAALALWPAAAATADGAPAATLTPHDGGYPVALATGGGGGSATDFVVAALSSRGGVTVWRVGPPPPPPRGAVASARPAAPPPTTLIARINPPPGAGAGALLAVAVGGDGGSLVLARGAAAAPTFQRVALPPAGAATAIDVDLPPPGATLVAGGTAVAVAGAKGARVAPAAVVDAQSTDRRAAAPRRKRGADADGDAADAAAPASPHANGHAPPPPRTPDPGTLGARLAALGVGGAPPPRRATTTPAPLPADSLAVALAQALRADDTAMLETCLAAGAGDGGKAACATVSRLAAPDAGLLLRALVARLRGRAGRAGALAPWLAALLAGHAAYLASAPGAAAPLADLCDLLAARAAAAAPLAGLAGRLDLVLAHARTSGGGGEVEGGLRPAVEYRESDDDDADGDAVADSDDDRAASDGWETDDGSSEEEEDGDGDSDMSE